LNITEGQSPSLGADALFDGKTVTLDISQVTPGTTANLVLRLVNNDVDVNTSVELGEVSPNNPPTGADKTITRAEDTTYTFVTGDFGFNDPNDSPANSLLAVKIATLPAAGSLTDNGQAISAGQFIPVGDITDGLLKFKPGINANGAAYTTFTFQ